MTPEELQALSIITSCITQMSAILVPDSNLDAPNVDTINANIALLLTYQATLIPAL